MSPIRQIKSLILILCLAFPSIASADEGMWLVQLMAQTNYKAMKSHGLKLKASQIYNEEQPSIKDAIVAIDYGTCTGSMRTDDHQSPLRLQRYSKTKYP